jgi:hypothetical protein
MRSVALALLVLALGAPGLAHAQNPNEPIGGGQLQPLELGERQNFRSPQHWAMELRFGPYRPDVDSEFSNGSRPYTEFFGTGSSFLFSVELDYQIWHGFGSLGVGGSVGWFSDSAKACLPGSCNTRSQADDSSINIVPFTLLAVYRFDVPAMRWNIPLVPYGKFGLAYDIWWITDASGDVATFGGGKDTARGGTFGYVAAGGLALLLDWLDPGSAVSLDSELGINHTYLFFEVYSAVVNGLGSKNALHVGDTTWSAGLAFEF